MPLDEEGRRLRGQLAGQASWANTTNRSARTSKARQALADRFADADDPEEAKREYYQELARKSAATRRENRKTREAATVGDSAAAMTHQLVIVSALSAAAKHFDEALAAIHKLQDHMPPEYHDDLDSAFVHTRDAYRFLDDVRQRRLIDR